MFSHTSIETLMFHQGNARASVSAVDDRLLDAAVTVLEEHGQAGLTLGRVAQPVGRSRVTLWRPQVTQESLVDRPLAPLAPDHRDPKWPPVAPARPGAARPPAAPTPL